MTQQDHSVTKKSSNFSLGIGVLLACSFGIATSNSIIFGALSDLQDKYNFSDSGLGFISAAGFLASLIVQLVVAPLADIACVMLSDGEFSTWGMQYWPAFNDAVLMAFAR